MAAPPRACPGPRDRGEAGLSSAAAVAASSPGPLAEALPGLSLREFVEGSGLRSLVVGVSKDPNAKITVLLVSPSQGRPVLAVKVPTTDAAATAVDRERRALVGLRRLRPGMMQTVPRVVDTVEFRGRPGLVMTALQGTPMTTSYLRWRHTASSTRVAAHFTAVGTWLAELQRETAGPLAPLNMDDGVASRLGTRFSDDERVGADLERLADIQAKLGRNTVPRTAVHGDLWLGNVLLVGGRASGVVDWEEGTTSGEPVRDLVRYALMYALFLDRRTKAGRRVAGHPRLRAGTWGAGVEYALDGRGWFPDLFRRFLGEGLARLGASPASWRDAALAGIAEVAALTDNPGFARHNLALFRRIVHSHPQREETGCSRTTRRP